MSRAKDGDLLRVDVGFRNIMNNARKIGMDQEKFIPTHKRNALTDYTPGGSEYTGGFRLVDMSEKVKDEEGNETEKVVPKLGVLGINVDQLNPMGTLYYTIGSKIQSSAGVVLDLSESTIDTTLHILAYWSGVSYGVKATSKASDLDDIVQKYGAPAIVQIGVYKVTKNELFFTQIHYGSSVCFPYLQPMLAKVSITDGADTNGYNAELYTYPLSNEFVRGRVFLAESCLGYQQASFNTWMPVLPVSVKAIDATED